MEKVENVSLCICILVARTIASRNTEVAKTFNTACAQLKTSIFELEREVAETIGPCHEKS